MENKVKKIFINGLEENKTFNEILDEMTECIIENLESKLESIEIYNKWYQLGMENDYRVYVKNSSMGIIFEVNSPQLFKINKKDIKSCRRFDDLTIKLICEDGTEYDLFLFK